MQNRNNRQKTALQTETLSLSYNKLRAVDSLSIKAYFNEILFILGPNGAGKTSLIKMLCGLISPDSGSVNYLDLSPQKPAGIFPSGIGYCPQHLSIWMDLTCHEQLIFLSETYGVPAEKSHKQIQLLLNSLCLTAKKDELAGKLSGGMQRCLNLALAMVHDPEILILDEPFAGLDIQNRFHIRQLLRSFAHARGKSVIISTHNINEADRLADRIIVMDEGAVIKTDTLEAIHSCGKGEFVIEVVFNDVEERLIGNAVKEISKILPDVIYLQGALMIYTLKKEESLKLINNILKKQSIVPIEIKVRDRSLEDLFIAITGKRFE